MDYTENENEDELNCGAMDSQSPTVRFYAQMEAIRRYLEPAVENVVNSMGRKAMDRIEKTGYEDAFKDALFACFKARHGARWVGVESVQSSDEELKKIVDLVFPSRWSKPSGFSDSKLTQTIDDCYHTHLNSKEGLVNLAARAKEAGASAEPQR